MSDIIRRCCQCNAVKIDGKYFASGSYEFKKGQVFSDGFFSRECGKNYAGDKFYVLFGDYEFELDRCPER